MMKHIFNFFKQQAHKKLTMRVGRAVNRRRTRRAIYRPTRRMWRDEQGFSTMGMVISLLLALALMFSGVQIYRINTASSEVQDIADAAALAAQNQVAEFMIIARFCDATALSLSLSGYACCGLGIAALCTPLTAELSASLLDAGKHFFSTETRFVDRAQPLLNKLQEALPYYAAVCAASVTAANNDQNGENAYTGLALLVPQTAQAISFEEGQESQELIDEIDENEDDIRTKAQEAEEASREANKAKEEAFRRDCGDNPNYCMYERAATLAGLSGARNPLFSNIDTWSFSAAFERAKNYYKDRSINEQPRSMRIEEIARWHLRLVFYDYASQTLEKEGYVHETSSSFEACLPHLPKNTDEMRSTSLYTDKRYVISSENRDGKNVNIMHAWDGCPGISGAIIAHGSIADMEVNDFAKCSVCEFAASSLGKVAAASTSIDNGFEYHYEAFVQAAEAYQKSSEHANPIKDTVKTQVQDLFSQLMEALSETLTKRIEVRPPGYFGAVALVVNTASSSSGGSISSSFSQPGTLGPRAAMSAATLLDEKSDEGRTIINSLLDGLKQDGSSFVGAAGIALNLWSKTLSVYAQGVDALSDGISSALDAIPLPSASGLGPWAAEQFQELLKGLGLEPVKIEALKPVLINSEHVARKDDSALSQNLLAFKQRIRSHPPSSGDLFSSFISDAEKAALDKVAEFDSRVEIASIDLLGDGTSISITIPLPGAVKQFSGDLIQAIFDRLRDLHAEMSEIRIWE